MKPKLCIRSFRNLPETITITKNCFHKKLWIKLWWKFANEVFIVESIKGAVEGQLKELFNKTPYKKSPGS
jgi:hypothetical protein